MIFFKSWFRDGKIHDEGRLYYSVIIKANGNKEWSFYEIKRELLMSFNKLWIVSIERHYEWLDDANCNTSHGSNER